MSVAIEVVRETPEEIERCVECGEDIFLELWRVVAVVNKTVCPLPYTLCAGCKEATGLRERHA